jgi:dTDP-glucose 4,6-dehydratase
LLQQLRYGDGQHQRDWIHVDDHVQGLLSAAVRGSPGERYLFGARTVVTNIALVHNICKILDDVLPDKAPFAEKIVFVPDRPGHDRRYSLDPTLTERALDWRASTALDAGLRSTVAWYIENQEWWRELLRSGYSAARLGLGL